MPHTIAAPVSSELLIRKSRFLGCVEPIDGRPAAKERVAALRAAHPGAAHVCWALIAGGDAAAVDDGEPSGTAGRPMLDVLRKQELENVLATVVRYFGGIKLGAGGLVRAYTDAVAEALLAAHKVPLQRSKMLAVLAPYPLEGRLRREIAAAEAALLDVQHGDRVRLRFSLPEDAAADLVRRIDEAGQGRVEWLADPWPQADGEADGAGS